MESSTEHSSTFRNWQSAENEKTNVLPSVTIVQPNDMISPNRYRTLIIGEEADFDKEYENNGTARKQRNLSEEKRKPDPRRSNVVVNQNPHIYIYKNPMHVPGNSYYVEMTTPAHLHVCTPARLHVCTSARLRVCASAQLHDYMTTCGHEGM